MTEKLIRFLLVVLVMITLVSCQKKAGTTTEKKEIQFEETWESLSSIEREPEWFKDAKLGIYFHWGVYSVPAYDSEWYPRWMYTPGRKNWGGSVFDYHQSTFGPVSTFNYHDFIPMFKAEHFDAKEWTDLFKSAGAKFAGPVGQHHDGFAMWGSKVNPWNAKDMGPKQDILGDLYREIKKNDMKTIVTFHHARLLQRYSKDTAAWAKNTPDTGWDSHYPYHPDYVTSSNDPKLRKLYGNLPAEEFHDYWLDQINEVVDTYAPDAIWFDSWLDKIPEDYRQKMVAHHFNTATSRGQKPIVVYKQTDLPADVGILDIEQGGKTEISEDYWLTDVTLSHHSWCYINGQAYKESPLIIRNMIDVWSKKGIVLLNMSPKANGEIPEEQRLILTTIGKWMDKHKEAIYETRVHSIYGYGDAAFKKGDFGGQSATMQYSEKDIRFTVSKDRKHLYVFVLGLPVPDATLEIRTPIESKVKKVSIVENGKEVKWSSSDNGLILETPGSTYMNEIATVFNIEFE